jgi:hypothetical protein
MLKESRLGKVFLYQNLGFLAVILLAYLDELARLSTLVFGDSQWQLGKSTLGMLMVLAVWFLVSTSTRRVLDRIRYLEKFMRICAWCHSVDHKGSWMPMEEFLRQGFDTPTTHGICPKCLAEQKEAIDRSKESRSTPSEAEA